MVWGWVESPAGVEDLVAAVTEAPGISGGNSGTDFGWPSVAERAANGGKGIASKQAGAKGDAGSEQCSRPLRDAVH